ncbi:class I SAM-dependent DNA methyltransferase [Sphingomonas sp. CFBP 13728]|uniref:class I SAM-dependent DNA methyltransferase n=1 Tax=Sphingomonas sp. CFBP 13728 TaxID=2775294 RepID=UPI00177EA72D|nr:class I SAM-dependent DNA methyltransferase [Sphingomonas sp. CFBP 13728]MBD8619298.1 class I SAM-dependent DNA methyltransferase [Sphingomonas sp. CFBP 13728]
MNHQVAASSDIPRSSDIDAFIARWRANEGGAERANFPLFLTELCRLIDVPVPDPADATHDRNDYVFERAVRLEDLGGLQRNGRIDLYRRGCFVLEAKQSRERGGPKEVANVDQASLPGIPLPEDTDRRGRRSAHRSWDVLMRNAREQAEQYARALPTDHGWPPFILVCDVGHAIELFADFSGEGKAYRQFPDRAGFRLYLDDLHDPAIRDRLRKIWLDPHALDPARHAAIVTRDIARRLADVSKRLEDRGHAPEPVAHFLMRCLFTMFAQRADLLNRGSFTQMLTGARDDPSSFAPMLEDLWQAMDTGGYSLAMRCKVRRFNGGLFAERTAIPLRREEIGELLEASRHDWTEVEPAIFGTLLEQALDPTERRRLGAHYTPRAYVERLVIATIIEPLQREWETQVLGTVERERLSRPTVAIRAVHDFHERLAATTVLDPACGTGNFLYVALELMKRLEGDGLEVLADLGGQEALALETATVHPRHFLGLELNPRAAAIAELVLWLGYLQWQLRNRRTIADPVLEKLDNIATMDAVLTHDGFAEDGTRTNPRRADWPDADYIVGNPPFIGKGSAMRNALGERYLAALWKAHPQINRSADFVMYWWDRAAERLTETGTRLKRFGFVTTNSITQEFSRRVITKRLAAPAPIGIVLAIPDHPWTKATTDAAAVRIAMTVVERGTPIGQRLRIVSEHGLDSDAPMLGFASTRGRINADLSIGANAAAAFALVANDGLSYNGMMLAARGFVLTTAEAHHLLAISPPAATSIVKPYVGGADLVRHPTNRWVIDAYGYDETALRTTFPAIYQHLLMTVKPVRDTNRRTAFKDRWWIFGEPRRTFRPALHDLSRYIGTTETAKHRIMQFLPVTTTPDHMVVCFALDDGFSLGVLSSRAHLQWTYANCGLIGVARFEQGHRYTKSRIADRFPFPEATPDQRDAIGALAEELDAARKDVLGDHPDLTMTGLYNLLARLRSGAAFDLVAQDQRQRGRVDILDQLHDRIDAAVAAAYGWLADLDGTAIVARLVALNGERHAEEKAGRVRWLRPDYQIACAGLTALPVPARAEQIEADLPAAPLRKPQFPRDAIGQTAAVLADLRSGAGLTSDEIARRYAQGQKVRPRIAATLAALTRLGHVAADGDRHTLRRAA